MEITNIGLALSGGGYRAAVYHLGVLARLSDDGLLEKVAAISSVSGGTLGTGLLLALNNLQWPSSQAYFNTILPEARRRLTMDNLEWGLIEATLLTFLGWPFSLFFSRAKRLSDVLADKWGLTAPLSKLPRRPRWFINATCYESGKDWRFDREQAGDYLIGHTHETDRIPLSDAMAASAGFPGLVGALPFKVHKYHWQRRPAADPCDTPVDTRAVFPVVHLWDGGVYDNQGLEVFHEFDYSFRGWQSGVDFLVVSDASGRAHPEPYRIGLNAIMRIITGVMMDQIRSLRARAVVARLKARELKSPGLYLQIGRTGECQLRHAGLTEAALLAQVRAEQLPPDVVARTEHLQTTIRRLTPEEFGHLFRHGYEITDTNLFAYYPETFARSPYLSSRWAAVVPA